MREMQDSVHTQGGYTQLYIQSTPVPWCFVSVVLGTSCEFCGDHSLDADWWSQVLWQDGCSAALRKGGAMLLCVEGVRYSTRTYKFIYMYVCIQVQYILHDSLSCLFLSLNPLLFSSNREHQKLRHQTLSFPCGSRSSCSRPHTLRRPSSMPLRCFQAQATQTGTMCQIVCTCTAATYETMPVVATREQPHTTPYSDQPFTLLLVVPSNHLYVASSLFIYSLLDICCLLLSLSLSPPPSYLFLCLSTLCSVFTSLQGNSLSRILANKAFLPHALSHTCNKDTHIHTSYQEQHPQVPRGKYDRQKGVVE